MENSGYVNLAFVVVFMVGVGIGILIERMAKVITKE